MVTVSRLLCFRRDRHVCISMYLHVFSHNIHVVPCVSLQWSPTDDLGDARPRSGIGCEPGLPRREYDSRVGWPEDSIVRVSGWWVGQKGTERGLREPKCERCGREQSTARCYRATWWAQAPTLACHSIGRAPPRATVHHLTLCHLNRIANSEQIHLKLKIESIRLYAANLNGD